MSSAERIEHPPHFAGIPLSRKRKVQSAKDENKRIENKKRLDLCWEIREDK